MTKYRTLPRVPDLPKYPSHTLSPSVAELIETREELTFDHARARLDCDGCSILKLDSCPGVEPPRDLPSILCEDRLYVLIPNDANLPHYFGSGASYLTDADALADGVAHAGPEGWPDDRGIQRSLEQYIEAGTQADERRRQQEMLERERRSEDLYAVLTPIDEHTPMLVEGLMRERGVSVFYGAWDEFKTTVVLDIAAHIAMGVDWQGRKVKPRPVIWYAFEGADEIPVRLRALETRLKLKAPAWGEDCIPVTCRDRKPDEYRDWRKQILSIYERWEDIYYARLGGSQIARCWDMEGEFGPVVVIDTLSVALGGEDEKGPKAAGFIAECLDLLKRRDDLPCDDVDLSNPAASHVIIIHHQTKTGIEFAGHRAIAANTQGLYRVHRFSGAGGLDRPYAGQITPYRVKGIPRPAAIRFEVDVVPVEGTTQTAAVLRDKAAPAPGELSSHIEALRAHGQNEIDAPDLNKILDKFVSGEGREGATLRKARQRLRDSLTASGVLEAVEDDDGKIIAYRFHDPVA